MRSCYTYLLAYFFNGILEQWTVGNSWECRTIYTQGRCSENKRACPAASRYLLRVFTEANSYVLSPLLARREVGVCIWKDWHPYTNSCMHVPAVVQHSASGFKARTTSGCIPTCRILTAGIPSSSPCYCNPVSTEALMDPHGQRSVRFASEALATVGLLCRSSHVFFHSQSLHIRTLCLLFLTRQAWGPPQINSSHLSGHLK